MGTIRAFVLLFVVSTLLCGCNGQRKIDPFQKEKEILIASQPEEYEVDGKKYKDYTKADRQLLVDWVKQDTSTLTHPFSESIKSGYVKVATSSDGKLRVYSWDTGNGGTMIWWANIIQYKYGKEVMTFAKSLYGVMHPEKSDEMEIDYGSHIDTILTVPTHSGDAIYLVEDYFRESSNLGYTSLQAICIKNGKLEEAPVFEAADGLHNSIGNEHTIADWYFVANMGEGWDWTFSYDTENKELYVATVDDMQCYTDQYDIYRFENDRFVYKRTSGPSWLNPELRTFKRLELLFETDNYIIRIDRMHDDKLRYASWKVGEKPLAKPDLVLYGGKESEYKLSFINGNYTYNIHLEEGSNMLEITHKGIVILESKQKPVEYF